ncbi:MAG: hypothetical protein Fur0032_00680 [Terrimicrobiaceae bacterium]
MAVLGAPSAMAQVAFQFNSGPAVGVALEGTPNGDDYLVNDPLGNAGTISLEGEEIVYNGTLFGESQPTGGWGTLQMTGKTSGDALSEFESAIAGLSDQALKTKLANILDLIKLAGDDNCLSSLFNLLSSFGKELTNGRALGNIPEGDSDALQGVVNGAVDFAQIRGASAGIPLGNQVFVKGKPQPPVAPKRGCRVRILIGVGNGDNGLLGDPASRFNAEPGTMIRLVAEGLPVGGFYTWSISPDPFAVGGAGFAQFANNTATLLSTANRKFVVTVTYTDATFKKCTDRVMINYEADWLERASAKKL